MSKKHLPLISTAEFKKKAREMGADLVGIGSVSMRHFFHSGFSSSGSHRVTRCPKAHVTR